MSHTNFFRSIAALSLLLWPTLPARAEEGVDTTRLDYQIGYQLGSWLPFLIIVLLVVLILRKSVQQYD